MPDQSSRSNKVQIAPAPVKVGHQRAERQSGIGNAPCHDDLRACLDSIGNRPGAQIGIDGNDVTIQARETPVAIPALRPGQVYAAGKVVAGDNGDPDRAQTQPGRDIQNGAGRSRRISLTKIADNDDDPP